MLAAILSSQKDEASPVVVLPLLAERSVYAPPAGRRIIAVAGISLIYALVMAGFLLGFGHGEVRSPPSAPIVVDLLPVASSPETPPEKEEASKPARKKEALIEPHEMLPIERTIAPTASGPRSMPNPVDPGPVEPETAAPRTQPARPAPKVSSNAAETWEGRVLARLIEHRRYPPEAQRRRQQGIPWIRFVMDACCRPPLSAAPAFPFWTGKPWPWPGARNHFPSRPTTCDRHKRPSNWWSRWSSSSAAGEVLP